MIFSSLAAAACLHEVPKRKQWNISNNLFIFLVGVGDIDLHGRKDARATDVSETPEAPENGYV